MSFKAMNPELFVKQNKLAMSLGTCAFAGCIMYFLYMQVDSLLLATNPVTKEELRVSVDKETVYYKEK